MAAANFGKVVIHYNGTNRGPIYLKDVGQRNQLGGGRGIYVNGQDRYVDYGTDATLIATADVNLSCSVLSADSTGVIKANVLNGSWTAEYIPDATGTI
jgi:hypothetical protein